MGGCQRRAAAAPALVPGFHRLTPSCGLHQLLDAAQTPPHCLHVVSRRRAGHAPPWWMGKRKAAGLPCSGAATYHR
ncbi:hypothetical protein K523DRAFT_75500 [Schizophyllum commune Tattone D]|nr:hypothetical protein K523DRAFT_75500 [Schizophyllum commune Tattone D]